MGYQELLGASRSRPSPDDWVSVCAGDRVPPGSGVAANVHGHQVAVVRTDDGRVFALDNRDPFTGANVLSRGIVGAHGDIPTVASPLRKQRFDLQTGVCLDEPEVVVGVHALREVDGVVEVRLRHEEVAA